MTKQTIRAWAVLTPKDWEEEPDELCPYGNGAQFQLPVFDKRAEAANWKAESAWDRGRLVRVVITVDGRSGKKKGRR